MRERITNDVKTAMKAGEKAKLATLRLVTAAIKSADIEAALQRALAGDLANRYFIDGPAFSKAADRFRVVI